MKESKKSNDLNSKGKDTARVFKFTLKTFQIASYQSTTENGYKTKKRDMEKLFSQMAAGTMENDSMGNSKDSENLHESMARLSKDIGNRGGSKETEHSDTKMEKDSLESLEIFII